MLPDDEGLLGITYDEDLLRKSIAQCLLYENNALRHFANDDLAMTRRK